MEIRNPGGIPTPYPNTGAVQTAARKAEETGEPAAVPAPAPAPERDTLELSEQAEEWLHQAGAESLAKAAPDLEADSEENVSIGGSVGINAEKLARMLAQARTKAQIRAVIAKIQQDLKECESGRLQGMEVDDASVRAAENLLNQARQRMGQAKEEEASPEEAAAFSLASLF